MNNTLQYLKLVFGVVKAALDYYDCFSRLSKKIFKAGKYTLILDLGWQSFIPYTNLKKYIQQKLS